MELIRSCPSAGTVNAFHPSSWKEYFVQSEKMELIRFLALQKSLRRALTVILTCLHFAFHLERLPHSCLFFPSVPLEKSRHKKAAWEEMIEKGVRIDFLGAWHGISCWHETLRWLWRPLFFPFSFFWRKYVAIILSRQAKWWDPASYIPQEERRDLRARHLLGPSRAIPLAVYKVNRIH